LFGRGDRRRTNDGANDTPSAGPSDTRSRGFLRSFISRREKEISLADVGQAISDGLRHDPRSYTKQRDRYKDIRGNIQKVIEFCDQKGQELLVNGIDRETHPIPNTRDIAQSMGITGNADSGDMTLNQTIEQLKRTIEFIRHESKAGVGYEDTTKTRLVENFESVARPFLIAMRDVYSRDYGVLPHPSGPPQYEGPSGGHQAPEQT
jgi:hypothetical protein